jgi:hypothetical protein
MFAVVYSFFAYGRIVRTNFPVQIERLSKSRDFGLFRTATFDMKMKVAWLFVVGNDIISIHKLFYSFYCSVFESGFPLTVALNTLEALLHAALLL